VYISAPALRLIQTPRRESGDAPAGYGEERRTSTAHHASGAAPLRVFLSFGLAANWPPIDPSGHFPRRGGRRVFLLSVLFPKAPHSTSGESRSEATTRGGSLMLDHRRPTLLFRLLSVRDRE